MTPFLGWENIILGEPHRWASCKGVGVEGFGLKGSKYLAAAEVGYSWWVFANWTEDVCKGNGWELKRWTSQEGHFYHHIHIGLVDLPFKYNTTRYIMIAEYLYPSDTKTTELQLVLLYVYSFGGNVPERSGFGMAILWQRGNQVVLIFLWIIYLFHYLFREAVGIWNNFPMLGLLQVTQHWIYLKYFRLVSMEWITWIKIC